MFGKSRMSALSRPLRIAGALAVGLSQLLPWTANAQSSVDSGSARLPGNLDSYLVEDSKVTLEKAKQIAIKAHPGSVVRAETKEHDGKQVHEIRVLNKESGEVTTVMIDAETGKIIAPAAG